MAGPGNSINETTTGITGFTGTTFVGTPVTNHAIIAGASTSSTLTNISPSATSGIPLVSNGASADPSFTTAAIAGGGTNATTMSTNTGIVKYDGTSLVTSTTAKIDSSDRYTNSSQPCFQVYLTTTASNVTGDGTAYNLLFDTTAFDQNSNITLNSSSKTIFTAPITGKYLFCGLISFNWTSGAGATSAVYEMVDSNGNTYRISQFNDGPTFNLYAAGFSLIIPMTAADNVFLKATVTGASGKNGNFAGLSGSTFQSTWSGFLVA